MDKINFDAWPSEERQWVLEFRHMLESLDPVNLSSHEALIESVPHSVLVLCEGTGCRVH